MSHIDTHSKQIEAWERKNDKKIKDFYEYAIANDDTKAAQQLLGMDSTIDAIIKTGTPEQKSQLVSYMTEAFAIEEREYKNKTATELMDKRDGTVNIAKHGPAYARIDRSESGGINIKNLFSRDDLKAIYKGIDTKPSNAIEPQKDLIGYTAFYRKNANNKERGYAMTLPGYTRVLGGKINTFDKGSQKEADAKTWLVENLRTDTLAQKAIKDALATKDLGPVSKESIKNLTPDQLITLLTKKEGLPLDGCTLSIDATPVFYLLAECANESLGLQIKAITCKDQNGVEIKKVSTDMTEEVLDGGRMVSVTNADGQSTLGKKTVFKAAVGGSRGFGGNANKNAGPTDGGVKSNPGNGGQDGGNNGGAGSGNGNGGQDGGNTGTGGT